MAKPAKNSVGSNVYFEHYYFQVNDHLTKDHYFIFILDTVNDDRGDALLGSILLYEVCCPQNRSGELRYQQQTCFIFNYASGYTKL